MVGSGAELTQARLSADCRRLDCAPSCPDRAPDLTYAVYSNVDQVIRIHLRPPNEQLGGGLDRSVRAKAVRLAEHREGAPRPAADRKSVV